MTTFIEQIESTGIYQINANDISNETRTPSPDTTTCNSCLQLSDNIPIHESSLRASPPPPPPPPPVTDESDENDSSTKIVEPRNNFLTHHRPSRPIIYSGYNRKKSHSVKLTRHDKADSYAKKAVRFADEFGLELNQMRMINTDEFPFIPNEAFKHLHINHEHHLSHQEHMRIIIYMELQFKTSMYTQDFNNRLSRQKIVLEQANAIDNRIYGTVRLVSFDLHKRVKIRLTPDNWISFRDYDATYINNSYDGIHDRFSFTLEIDRHQIYVGNIIQFSICYESFGGQEYWDNNSQQNYRLNCCARTIPDYGINGIF